MWLNNDLRHEAETLVTADVNEWRAEIAARLRADLVAEKFTRRAAAEMVGVHESYMGRVIAEPERMSDRVVGLLSITVAGYEDVYAELRRRADQLYLTEPGRAPASTSDAAAARLREITKALQDDLPAVLAAVAKLEALAGKVGSGDV